MHRGEHLLIISHTFPPYRGIGGRRWAKFAKALARRGITVHVIHSAGREQLKGSFWTEDIVHPGIVVHPLRQRYPTVLFKRPLTTLWEKIAYRFWMRAMPMLVKGNWFDKAVFWESPLLRKSRELIAAHHIRNVVVTGAPFRLMAHALKLRGEHPGLNLIADFRDPWTWGHVYGHGTLSPVREAHEKQLEMAVVRGFDKVISPAPAIIDHLRATYGADPSRYVHIPHAIDPEEMGGLAERKKDGVFRMIYAGSLYGAQEAETYFDALLGAFQRTRELHPEMFKRCVLDLYISGHDTAIYRAKVKAAGLQETILFHAPRIASKLLPRIAQADLVLIFIPSINKDFLGTKFTEIFLRRPVVHIGVPGLVSETVVRNRLGISLPVEALAGELPGLISGERKVEIDGGYDLSDYLLESITGRLMREVLG